jgi:hypothetical protein
MKIWQVIKEGKVVLYEGGNLSVGQHQAQHLDLKVTKRDFMVPILNNLLKAIDLAYYKQYNEPLWGNKLLSTGKFLSGSSLHFFNVQGISDEVFVKSKPTVGDIDTMVDKNKEENLKQFLLNSNEQKIGPATLLGFQRGNEQFSALWELDNPPVKIQIDFEFVEFVNGLPTDWARFSHSSAWEDLGMGIKGVFHKFLIRALTSLTAKTFLLKKSTGKGSLKKEKYEPTTDNLFSFSVSSKEGGGLRAKYEPVIDPSTNKIEVRDGLPVMTAAPTSGYEQNIKTIFSKILGHKLNDEQISAIEKNFWSYTGLLQAMSKMLSPEEKQKVVDGFLKITIGPGSQGLYKNNPDKDIKEKMVAIDTMLKSFNMSKPSYFDQMLSQYRQSYKMTPDNDDGKTNEIVKNMAKKALDEETKPNYKRVGIQHLYNPGSSAEIKDVDFINLCKDIANMNGRLDDVDVSLKVDGAGIRFGKDEEGNPFFMTSRVDTPMYKQNIGDFEKYGRSQGQSEDQLERTKNYDRALDTIVNAKFMQDLPNNTIVQAEMLFNPMAQKSQNGLTFVNIPYDPGKLGKKMTLVPISVRDFDTGSISPNSKRVLNDLYKNDSPDIKMVNMALANPGIDVKSIVDPIAKNASDLTKALTQRGSSPEKQEAKQIISSAKKELSEAIYNSPIKGKDQLGDYIEGLVLRMPNGLLLKITSAEMKEKMAAKKANVKKPTTDSERTKPAVVTIGSFVGHIGHQWLINKAIQTARKMGGDPYIYVSPSMGPDDPIPPDMKVKTLQKLFPEYANNIKVWSPDGTPVKKIEKELVLPSDSPYNKIVVIVGEDRYEGFKKWLESLEKRMKDPVALAKYGGTQDQVDYEIIGVPRNASGGGNDMSFTRLRNVLKDPNKSEEEQLETWKQGFDTGKLGDAWVREIMKTAKKTMSLTEQVKKFIKHTKPLLKSATNEQKVKFYNLLKEAKDEIEKQTDGNKKSEEDFMYQDPETQQILSFARQHYPSSKNKQQAFMKFVQRSLRHSETTDNRQDSELERIQDQIDQLQQKVKSLGESKDYIDEK